MKVLGDLLETVAHVSGNHFHDDSKSAAGFKNAADFLHVIGKIRPEEVAFNRVDRVKEAVLEGQAADRGLLQAEPPAHHGFPVEGHRFFN